MKQQTNSFIRFKYLSACYPKIGIIIIFIESKTALISFMSTLRWKSVSRCKTDSKQRGLDQMKNSQDKI